MANFLDRLKNLGFKYATESGISFSLFELPFSEVGKKKKELLSQAQKKVDQVDEYLNQGFYNELEAKEEKIAA